MIEEADVYRVRDNQRGATLIIVIRILSLKRRVTRTRHAACALRRTPATRVTHAGGFKEPPIVAAPPARCIYVHARIRCVRLRPCAGEMQRAICVAAYESICRG